MTQRATFICGGELVPASRFRVHPIANALAVEGWHTRVIHGYGALDHQISYRTVRSAYRLACRIRRATQTACLSVSGPVMVQRLALPWYGRPEVLLAQKGTPLVFDFDDAVFLDANGQPSATRRKALNLVFGAASYVVAGNTWLAGIIAADVTVTVIPTCIDTQLYRPEPQVKDKKILRIGWIGTSSNFRYLKQLVEPLAKLRTLGFAFEFAICSDESDSALFSALRARFEKWTPDGELRFLQSLDIGIMPLEDSDWCRGKCSFKLIQYMAVGCPVVASPIGMNNDVLEGDFGGRLVQDNEWVAALADLLESADYRQIAGLQARQRAIERYDISVAIGAYSRILSALQ